MGKLLLFVAMLWLCCGGIFGQVRESLYVLQPDVMGTLIRCAGDTVRNDVMSHSTERVLMAIHNSSNS